MKIILILEILLFAVSFAALQRALRKRVDEAVRWEASVAVEMNRVPGTRAARARVLQADDRLAEPGRDPAAGYRDRVQPATL